MLGFEHFLGMMGQRSFNVQLRCYSIPFFPRADTYKINAMDYGGNVRFIYIVLILFQNLDIIT